MIVSLLLLNECSYVFAGVLFDPRALKRQLPLNTEFNTRRADNRPISLEPGEISTSRSAGVSCEFQAF